MLPRLLGFLLLCLSRVPEHPSLSPETSDLVWPGAGKVVEDWQHGLLLQDAASMRHGLFLIPVSRGVDLADSRSLVLRHVCRVRKQ